MNIETKYPDPWEAEIETRASRFDEPTPEPNPVFVCVETCQDHGYNLVSMPRNQNQEYFGFKYKCPLSGCPNGIERHV